MVRENTHVFTRGALALLVSFFFFASAWATALVFLSIDTASTAFQ
jgi:hypothetical protein